ncbi:type II toxin-antitoxin system VapC family toxin [Microgenomates group bacterium]|nr:type II toxin-antitoxin system VapC family toxin [Microgenomates group bacterium]
MNKQGVLLDTSVLIDFLRQKQKRNTWFYALAKQGQPLAASIITHTELFAGVSVWEKSKARKELEAIFSGISLILLNQEVSILAGKIRAKNKTDLIDAIIAATAVSEKITLATLNPKHFKKISGLRLVKKVLNYKS